MKAIKPLLLSVLLAGCLFESKDDRALLGTYANNEGDYTDEYVFLSGGRFEYRGYEDFSGTSGFGGEEDCWTAKCKGFFSLEGGQMEMTDVTCAEARETCGDFGPYEALTSISEPFKWDGDKCFLAGSGEDQARYCKP